MICKPLISIIVPVYNVEKYIERCINSILSQSYDNYELILIDDGSSDSSLNICKSFVSDNVVVISQSNEGVSSARNRGIDIAKGDFISFIDGDDWVEEDYIASFFSDDYLDLNMLYIQGIKREYTNCTKLTDVFPDSIVDEKNYSYFIPKYKLFHSGYPVAKLFNLSIIREYNLRFEIGLQTHEDHLFVLKYHEYVKGICLKKGCGYHYMINQAVNTLSKKRHDPQMLFKASDLFFKEYKVLLKKFVLLDDGYIDLLYTDYGLTQRIKALLNMYMFQYDRSVRLTLLVREFRLHRKVYLNHYCSAKKIRNLILFILLYLPLSGVDVLFYCCNKMLNLKK